MFDHILCVNLDDRADKWDQCVKHFNEIGLHNVQRFSAIRPARYTNPVHRGILGCRQSHIDCIKLAKANNWDSVLILEDDVEFHSSVGELSAVCDTLQSTHWHLCYFGANLEISNNVVVDSSGLLRLMDGALTTHCYAVNNTAYDILLTYFASIEHLPVISASQQAELAIDSIYRRLSASGQLVALHSRQLLCSQRPGFSDIRGAHRDYKIKEQFTTKTAGLI